MANGSERSSQEPDITELFFKIGGYFDGFHKVLIRMNHMGAAVCAYHTEWGDGADFCSIKPFSDDAREKLEHFLFDEIHVMKWKGEYVKDNVCDGTEWCLGITFSDGSQRGFEGSNAYPPLFEELEMKFEEIYRETTEDRLSMDRQQAYLPMFSDVVGISDALAG